MHGPQFAEDAVESDIRAFPVVRMDKIQISAGRERLLAVLDFVNHDIIPMPILFDLLFDVGKKDNRILKLFRTGVFKVDLDYVIAFYSAFYEVFLEELEQEIAFAASPDAGDYFHEIVVLGIYDAIQQLVSSYDHGASLRWF